MHCYTTVPSRYEERSEAGSGARGGSSNAMEINKVPESVDIDYVSTPPLLADRPVLQDGAWDVRLRDQSLLGGSQLGHQHRSEEPQDRQALQDRGGHQAQVREGSAGRRLGPRAGRQQAARQPLIR